MTVLSFDPGPAASHWALVASEFDRHRVLGTGVCHTEPEHLSRTLRANAFDVLAIEDAGGYLASTARARNIMTTNRVSGLLAGMAFALGHRTFTLPANAPGKQASWRYYLTRNPTAGDQGVRAALEQRERLGVLEGLPARCGPHARDAIGLAVVTLLMDGRMP